MGNKCWLDVQVPIQVKEVCEDPNFLERQKIKGSEGRLNWILTLLY